MMQSVLTRSRMAARRVAAETTGHRRRSKATVIEGAQSVTAPTTTTTSTSTSTSAKEAVPIGASLLAALCGVTTVSVAAAAVEYSTANSCLPYSANGQRYSQAEFTGRFCRMLLACDPRLLLYTEDQVRQAQALLLSDKASTSTDGIHGNYDAADLSDRSMDRTLWEARRIVDSALHPDTGEIVPRPFRMSGFVPYNGPICVAMVASTSTMPLLFWSWVNQSQNALVNYNNRNASSPMGNDTLFKSYAAAVGSALVVAFGLATMIQKRYPAEKAKQLMKYVAFPSAIVASSLNCYIVRSPEMDTGIPLMDEHGNNVLPGQTSKEAATRGVNSTTVSRAILQAPVYFVPPLLMGAIAPLSKFLAKHPTTRVPVTTYLLLTSFGIGLPATTAIFPQIVEISADQVEEQFHHLQDPSTQKPYKVYYYNKGL